MIERITNKKSIQPPNLRYSVSSGVLDGRPVFIKTAIDPALKAGIANEAAGLKAMRTLDPMQTHYSTPQVLCLTDDTIVTTWADGELMIKKLDQLTVTQYHHTLIELFLFLDGASPGSVGITRYNRPNEENNVEKTMKQLEGLHYEKHIDHNLVEKTAHYALSHMTTIETRFTHGDLQPNNIIVTPKNQLWVIDCESCDKLWPRHYNLVNFVFNYGVHSDLWRKRSLMSAFDTYFAKLGINPHTIIDQINFSAAMRCLQRINEELGDHTEVGKGILPVHLHDYLVANMKLITEGQLFVGVLSDSITRS